MKPEPEYEYAARFVNEFVPKYRAGRREHQTELTSRDCLAHAMEEVLDLWAYLNAMQQQKDTALLLLDQLLDVLEEVRSDSFISNADHALALSAYNILKFGNKEGRPEGLPLNQGE